jgi:hypothetical protein
LARRSMKSKGIRNQFAALRVMGCLGQGFRSENTKWDASTIGKMPQEPLLAFISCRSAPPAARQSCCHPPYCGMGENDPGTRKCSFFDSTTLSYFTACLKPAGIDSLIWPAQNGVSLTHRLI